MRKGTCRLHFLMSYWKVLLYTLYLIHRNSLLCLKLLPFFQSLILHPMEHPIPQQDPAMKFRVRRGLTREDNSGEVFLCIPKQNEIHKGSKKWVSGFDQVPPPNTSQSLYIPWKSPNCIDKENISCHKTEHAGKKMATPCCCHLVRCILLISSASCDYFIDI